MSISEWWDHLAQPTQDGHESNTSQTDINTNFKSYEGEHVGGFKHGFGKLFWTDGSTYEGQFHGGSIMGEGVLTDTSGCVCIGQWVDGHLHGQGNCWWPNGQTYNGNYERNKRHGDGTLNFPDGRVFAGQWVHGKQHGLGLHIPVSGEPHWGRWIAGKRAQWVKVEMPPNLLCAVLEPASQEDSTRACRLPVGELRSHYDRVTNAHFKGVEVHSKLSGLANEIQRKKTSPMRDDSSEEIEYEQTSTGSVDILTELSETTVGSGIESVHGTSQEMLPSTACSVSSIEGPSELLTPSAQNIFSGETEHKHTASSTGSVCILPEPFETEAGSSIESVHGTSQEILASTACSTSSVEAPFELLIVDTSVGNGIASVPRTSQEPLLASPICSRGYVDSVVKNDGEVKRKWNSLLSLDLLMYTTRLFTEGNNDVTNIRPSALFLLAGILNFSLNSYAYVHLQVPPLQSGVSTITRSGLSTGIGLLWCVDPWNFIATALFGVIYAPRHIPFSLLLGGVMGIRRAQA